METLITIGVVIALISAAGIFIQAIIENQKRNKSNKVVSMDIQYEDYVIDKNGIVNYINPKISYK